MYRKAKSIYLEGGNAKRILFSLTFYPCCFTMKKLKYPIFYFKKVFNAFYMDTASGPVPLACPTITRIAILGNLVGLRIFICFL